MVRQVTAPRWDYTQADSKGKGMALSCCRPGAILGYYWAESPCKKRDNYHTPINGGGPIVIWLVLAVLSSFGFGQLFKWSQRRGYYAPVVVTTN